MKLLLDIGNTRLKWALARDGRFADVGALAHDGQPEAALARLPEAAPQAIWIGHVVGAAHEPAFTNLLQARYGREPRFARAVPAWRGLRNAYAEPTRLGVDRWLVLVAAWAQRPGQAACVVDAGTALTADCIDAQGGHLGGFIAGGLDTQQRAVLGATRFATRPAEARYDGGLGRDTESCVRQGAMLACLGAIDRAAALAGAGARRLITGGDAPRLLPELAGGWEHRPQLVLEGLLALAEEA